MIFFPRLNSSSAIAGLNFEQGGLYTATLLRAHAPLSIAVLPFCKAFGIGDGVRETGRAVDGGVCEEANWPRAAVAAGKTRHTLSAAA